MKPYQHFGLVRPPFESTPDPRFFYGSTSHGETLATLEFSVYANKTCTVVIGESGAGKTLLARLTAAKASRRTSLLWVHGIGQPRDVTEVSVFSPGSLSGPPSKLAVEHTTLAQWTRTAHRSADPPLLVVDDGDELPDNGWRDIVSLLSREIQFPAPVNLVLFGMPWLLKTLALSSLVRLRRRVFRTCGLLPLSSEQIGAYVRCRLAVAGGREDADTFGPEALRQVHRLTRGNPGLVNQVCDNAMLEAFGDGRRQITMADVLAAARAIVGAPHVLPPGTDTSIRLGTGPARALPSRLLGPARPAVQRVVATSVAKDAEEHPTLDAVRNCCTVADPSEAEHDRVIDADVVGVEQRLSHLQTRLTQALTSVREARAQQEAAIHAVGDRLGEATPTPAASAPDEAARAAPENAGSAPADEPVAPRPAPASPEPACENAASN